MPHCVLWLCMHSKIKGKGTSLCKTDNCSDFRWRKGSLKKHDTLILVTSHKLYSQIFTHQTPAVVQVVGAGMDQNHHKRYSWAIFTRKEGSHKSQSVTLLRQVREWRKHSESKQAWHHRWLPVGKAAGREGSAVTEYEWRSLNGMHHSSPADNGLENCCQATTTATVMGTNRRATCPVYIAWKQSRIDSSVANPIVLDYTDNNQDNDKQTSPTKTSCWCTAHLTAQPLNLLAAYSSSCAGNYHRVKYKMSM